MSVGFLLVNVALLLVEVAPSLPVHAPVDECGAVVAMTQECAVGAAPVYQSV